MTPRQAQLVLLSFAILAAGVAFNALVLQRRPLGAAEAAPERAASAAPMDRGRKSTETSSIGRNAPRTSETLREESTPLRIARFAPDSAKVEAMPEPGEDESDAATITAIQRELKQRNYGPLQVDGILRPTTRAAIMAFEYDRGLPLSGEASSRTLKQILLGAQPGEIAGGGKVRSSHAQEMVRGVQKSLVALGYQSGPPDGKFGEDTIKAIRDFEMDKGLVPKGRVSADLVVRLNEAVASAKR
jgi:peptidoglycan hydrolase-like protein with peptidoglycan-binding domain